MTWRVEVERRAARELRKLDGSQRRRLLRFLRERIATVEDPRRTGKAQKWVRGPAAVGFGRGGAKEPSFVAQVGEGLGVEADFLSVERQLSRSGVARR